MKIAMVSEHASPLACLGGVDAGGQNVHVAALSQALAARGHEVIVYTRRDDPALPTSVRFAPGVQVVHLTAGPARAVGKDDLLPYMDALGGQLRQRFRRDKPELVHAHFWMSGLAALRAAADCDVPVLQTFHALGKVKRRWQGPLDSSPAERIGAERLIARTVDRIIATCTDEVGELQAMGVARSRIEVVPCGVDLTLFQPEPRPGDGAVLALPAGGAADVEQAQPARPARLLVLGRLVARKGIADAIQALARMPGAELLVVGGPAPHRLAEDEEAQRLRTVALAHGVADRVRLLGQLPHSELPAILRSCDLLVAVPWYEPFGIAPLEAMACGLPVVASAVGGLRDTVLDGVTGRLVEPRRPDELADIVNELLADRRQRDAMARAGRDRVLTHYGWNSVAAQTEACYRSVLAGRALVSRPVSGPARLADVTELAELGRTNLSAEAAR